MHRRHFLKTSATASLLPLVGTTALAQTTQSKNPKVKELRDRIKPITKEEREQRIEKARKLMTDQNMDALILEGGMSLYYFTGVQWGRSERLFAMMLPKDGDPFFIAPKFEEGRALEQVAPMNRGKLYTWEEHESPYLLIKKMLFDMNLLSSIVGVEETVRYFVTDELSQQCPGLNFVSGTPITAGCRSVKSKDEINLMQIANDITAEVFTSAVKSLDEGMTQRDFSSLISDGFKEFGVGGGALVLFGEASAYPHGTVKEYKLKPGDIVLIDGGCSVEGYASDVTRTTVFGAPSEKMERVFSIVRKAQSAALAYAKPDVPGENIDTVARKVISDAGYGPDYKYFTHRLGHGIGLEGHEWYYLVRGNKRLEQAGNMHSNEPGIYIPGEFGIRLEDEMLITPEGAKLLLPQAESLVKIF